MKTCRICQNNKPTDSFYPREANKGGFRTECKTCHSSAGKHSYQKRPRERARVGLATHLHKKYKLTVAGWDELYKKQGGVCAICRQPETVVDPRTGTRKKLSVDHDHKTDMVRSLLCVRCNRTLGFVNEDLAILDAMSSYVKLHHVH